MAARESEVAEKQKAGIEIERYIDIRASGDQRRAGEWIL